MIKLLKMIRDFFLLVYKKIIVLCIIVLIINIAFQFLESNFIKKNRELILNQMFKKIKNLFNKDEDDFVKKIPKKVSKQEEAWELFTKEILDMEKGQCDFEKIQKEVIKENNLGIYLICNKRFISVSEVKNRMLNLNDLIILENMNIQNIPLNNFVNKYKSYKDLVSNIHHTKTDFQSIVKSDLISPDDKVTYNKYKALIILVQYIV